MQKKIVILILLLLLSCTQLPDSKGEFNEIIILSSSIDRTIFSHHIDKLFSGYINTPSVEPLYRVKWIDEKKFKYYFPFIFT